ncbi:MAG: hypothetical protein LC624_05990 [Halobacteriales archaeon]|nr:hypothetical protein [Halobacteriales archaeon]
MPLKNKPGTLGELTRALAQAGVNVTGVNLTALGDFGIARVVTNEAAKTEQALRSKGYPFRSTDVLVVRVPSTPGKLAEVAEKLARSGVNVEEAYGVATGTGEAELVLRVDDIASAQKTLHL